MDRFGHDGDNQAEAGIGSEDQVRGGELEAEVKNGGSDEEQEGKQAQFPGGRVEVRWVHGFA